MRFTKIPLIATLMAVALSLLIVLPTIAQTDELTDGKQSAGVITVGVFDDIRDAQLAKLEGSGFAGVTPEPFIPVTGTPALLSNDVTAGEHANDDEAFLANRAVDPQNTFFRNTLYVSNSHANDSTDFVMTGAFNTVLINVAHAPALTGTTPDALTCVQDDSTTLDVNERHDGKALFTATVTNNSSGEFITMDLVGVSAGANSQAFFKVVEEGATIDHDDDASTPLVPFRLHDGPTWCDNNETRGFDADDDGTIDDTASENIQEETAATSAVYLPVDMPGFNDVPLAGDAPPAQQEIATIFADHGDRLTITTSGGSGVIELVVDGEGPEFTAITPDDNAVTRSSRLTFSFEVRDDDSGLRHDGESIISSDGDYDEINPDGDHALHSEPLSENPGTAVSANGRSADIDVRVVENPANGTGGAPLTESTDISASGTWSMVVGSPAGVAYSFTASGADKNDENGGNYLYQLVATDRAGNTAMTDADSDTENAAEPYVFRVDDTEPGLVEVRTGITWDSQEDKETVDRSYIALEFKADGTADALGDVDTDKITVDGHTIVGVIHPSERPVINRNTPKAAAPTGPAPDGPPAVVEAPPDPKTRTDLSLGTGDITLADTCSVDTAPTAAAPGNTPIVIHPSIDITEITAEETAYCAAWESRRMYLIAKNTYDNYTQYKRENPGEDIEGVSFIEPRARVYLELSEDLAADAEPDVLVADGAVFDLAGNRNKAGNVEAQDWIAPSLTVTVTGTANDRPIVNEDGSFSVDVRSDEDLRRRPVVFFVDMYAIEDTTSDDEYSYAIKEADEASPLTQQEDENHWARNYKRSSIDINLFIVENGRIIGVVVLGHDAMGNSGATAGWTPGDHRDAGNPARDNSLDLAKMDGADLLVEIDEEFNGDVSDPAMIGEVTPRSDDDGEETESSNPFVKLDFAAEGGEYQLCQVLANEDDCRSDLTVEYDDSHDTVTVTEITLNGDDVMAHLNRVSATQFSLVLRDLAVDSYTVEFVAEDEAGNELDDGEFSFEVKERQPYEIDVKPGWNLISLPATPLEPAIGSVLANNSHISPVLGYQEGDWLTAVREEDGTWRGRLTEIAGGYGYWVHARTFESVETMLSEVDPAGTLPTVPVTAGWNLLGVLDIFQNDAGDPPGETVKDEEAGTTTIGDGEADNYFSSIPWRVSYAYNTTQSQWEKAVPDVNDNADDEVLNGRGYWVWSPTPGTLVP